MFVRNENGVEIFRFFTDLGEPPRQFPHAEARVDQNPGFRGGKERRIAPAAACKYTEPDQETILPRFVLTQKPCFITKQLRSHLLLDDVHQFLDRARALVERSLLLGRQFNFVNLLDAVRT